MNDFILGPQTSLTTSWFDTTQVNMARKLGQVCPAIPPTDPQKLDEYALHLQYYDLAKSEYILHKRTNDPEFLNYARNAADSWWQHPWLGSGLTRPWPDSATPPPRHAGIGGLILRAIDGKPEYWDFCVEYTRTHLNIWLLWRLGNPKLHVDIREGAFVFHYATWLAKVLPDWYPLQGGVVATNGAQIRAQLHADLNKIVIDYYQRLQYPCGCWRYDANMPDAPNPQNPTGDGGMIIGITQPFTIGLLLLAFADFHQITTDTIVKESLKNQSVKVLRHLYLDGPYRKNDPTPFDANKKWRCFWYLFHGGTTVNPTKFEQGGWSLPGVNANEVSDARQSIGPVVAAYAYAHKISGDPVLLEAFNELWDAAYNGSDGIRNLMGTDGKGFNQNCARAGSGPAWLGTAAPIPAPQPISPPPPPPPPLPPPPSTSSSISITGISSGATLSGTVAITAAVIGDAKFDSTYLIVDDQVVSSIITPPYTYALNTVKLIDGEHSMYIRAWDAGGSATNSAKVSFTVKNLAAPPPPPPPAVGPPIGDIQKGTWPSTEAGQEVEINKWWAKGYRVKTTKVTGAFALFIKEK